MILGALMSYTQLSTKQAAQEGTMTYQQKLKQWPTKTYRKYFEADDEKGQVEFYESLAGKVTGRWKTYDKRVPCVIYTVDISKDAIRAE